jgi:hypothetical protein
MVRIHFPNSDVERKAIAFLVGRFNFKTWSNGETLVPESALAALAVEGIAYTVEGPATYEQSAPAIRDTYPLDVI